MLSIEGSPQDHCQDKNEKWRGGEHCGFSQVLLLLGAISSIGAIASSEGACHAAFPNMNSVVFIGGP